MTIYRINKNREHPTLKKSQYKKIAASITAFASEFGADDIEHWQEMIEGHFARTDKLDTDYNINHFATDGIMRNLFYKKCY